MKRDRVWYGLPARVFRPRHWLAAHAMIVALIFVPGCASTPRGKLMATDRPFDFAIDGEGYFIVETGLGGYLFTRKGDFIVDGQRYLASADGYRIAPPIQLPENTHDLTVTLDGQLMAFTAGTTRPQPAGRIIVATFANPSALKHEDHYFLPTAGSGDPKTHIPGSGGAGTLRSRTLEK